MACEFQQWGGWLQTAVFCLPLPFTFTFISDNKYTAAAAAAAAATTTTTILQLFGFCPGLSGLLIINTTRQNMILPFHEVA